MTFKEFHIDMTSPEKLKEAMKKLEHSDTLNGLITTDVFEDFIAMDRSFMECRDCGKMIGVSIALNGTDMDFECIDCYNESVKDGI